MSRGQACASLAADAKRPQPSLPRFGAKAWATPGIEDRSAYKSDFLRVLDERGFIHQLSDPEGLDAAAKAGRITAYVGYDATATSLHLSVIHTYAPTRPYQSS